jgi:Pyruvate/2-oxoacid:ferredoxin oxidoreductase delta subunit
MFELLVFGYWVLLAVHNFGGRCGFCVILSQGRGTRASYNHIVNGDGLIVKVWHLIQSGLRCYRCLVNCNGFCPWGHIAWPGKNISVVFWGDSEAIFKSWNNGRGCSICAKLFFVPLRVTTFRISRQSVKLPPTGLSDFSFGQLLNRSGCQWLPLRTLPMRKSRWRTVVHFELA